MVAVLILITFADFRKKPLLEKMVTMATQKRVCLIHELGNFADTWFQRVAKFQGDGLSRFGVLSHLVG